MNAQELVAEGERLARDAVVFDENTAESVAAHWYGMRPGEPCFAMTTVDGWLVIYPDGNGSGRIVADALALGGGVSLFAHQIAMPAPIEGIFKFGGTAVQQWLASLSWDPYWGYNDNFPDAAPVMEYESWWRAKHPFYGNAAYAIAGGWPFVWPDGDWLSRIDRELLVWTLRDAEPWVEVWKAGDGYEVIERVT